MCVCSYSVSVSYGGGVKRCVSERQRAACRGKNGAFADSCTAWTGEQEAFRTAPC